MPLLYVLLLELVLDGSESLVNLNLAAGVLLDLSLLGDRVFVRVLDAQLSDEHLHIELIADLLSIEQQFLHLETALPEVFVQVKFLVLVLTHHHVTEVVLLLDLALRFFLLLRFNRSGVLRGELNGFLHENLHLEDVKVVLFADHFSLLFLPSKGVAHQTDLHCQPVGCLRMLQFGALGIVDLDDLLQGVAEQEVVVHLVCYFQLCLFEGCLNGSTLGWSLALALDIHFNRRVQDLIEFRLVLGDNIRGPLALVLQVVHEFELVQF